MLRTSTSTRYRYLNAGLKTPAASSRLCKLSLAIRSRGSQCGDVQLQVLGPDRLAMHWQEHKGGQSTNARLAKVDLREFLPPWCWVATPRVCGPHSAPMPPDLDEYLLAGWLRGKPVEFVKCVSQPLEVPANAEIVIEVMSISRSMWMKAPSGPYRILHTAGIFPRVSRHCDHASQESHLSRDNSGNTSDGGCVHGKSHGALVSALVRVFLPEVLDYHLPAAGVFHNLVLVKIKKRYPDTPEK